MPRPHTYNPGDQKPSFDGVYYRWDAYMQTEYLSAFKNGKWRQTAPTVAQAAKVNLISAFQKLPWRSLDSQSGEK